MVLSLDPGSRTPKTEKGRWVADGAEGLTSLSPTFFHVLSSQGPKHSSHAVALDPGWTRPPPLCPPPPRVYFSLLFYCCFLTADTPGARPHSCLVSGALHWKLGNTSGLPTRKHLPYPLTRLGSSDLCYLGPVLVPGPCRVSPKLGFWIWK